MQKRHKLVHNNSLECRKGSVWGSKYETLRLICCPSPEMFQWNICLWAELIVLSVVTYTWNGNVQTASSSSSSCLSWKYSCPELSLTVGFQIRKQIACCVIVISVHKVEHKFSRLCHVYSLHSFTNELMFLHAITAQATGYLASFQLKWGIWTTVKAI